MIHKLMDAMSAALTLRSAGLTPHFHAERSSNGSCGGPPPVRSWPGRWKNPRRRLMSQPHSVLQSVPLERSVPPSHASCLFRCPSPLFCTALRRLISRAVEAAMLAFLSSSWYFWYNGQGRLHGRLRSSDGDGPLFLSELFWETACYLR